MLLHGLRSATCAVATFGVVAVSTMVVQTTGAGTVAYVDDDADPAGDGTSWVNAYRFLQDALAFAANPDNGINEIRVAQGLYLPDRNEANPVGTGDRESTLQLVTGVALLGGYAGIGAPDPDERDTALYTAVLSGDVGLNDGPNFANNGENVYQVVTASGTDPTALLDGFTITAGNADAIHFIDNGAGMYTQSGSPTVRHCTFAGNRAGSSGGGMFNGDGNVTVSECVFVANVAGFGGGMQNTSASTTVIDCAFLGNSASDGGGMMNVGSSPVVANCIFVDNTALFEGGGMFNRDFSDASVSNCTFVGNAGSDGGAVRISAFSGMTIANSILWGNTASDGPGVSLFFNSSVSIAYTDIEGGEAAISDDGTGTVNWLAGNMDADPAFVNRLGPDGNPGTGDENVRLLSGSPCIDAGHNLMVAVDAADLDGDGDVAELLPLDLDGQPRFAGDKVEPDPGCGEPVVVDMGAYEFQGEPLDVILGDIDGDGIVGINDFLDLLAAWGACVEDCCLADLDLDGQVGINDFLDVLANWS